MEKIINLLINNWTKGVDTYTHNGSTWLIFSESKQWVIELTESKTLWYNYNFFKELFSLTSMDVVDNQHYITKWVEDNLINVPKCTEPVEHTRNAMTKDTIKYGIKDTILEKNITEGEVDDIIQDGVKETSSNVMMFQSMKVEDTIQNGVKRTITSENRSRLTAENIIENGVKHTEIGWHQCNNIDDAIEKGVKETMFNRGHKQLTVKNIIENGVKEIYDYKGHRWDVKDVIQDGVRDISPMTQYTDWQVEEIIENGVKETNHVDVMKFFDNKMDDVIENGVKETNHIKNNVRETKQFEEHLADTIDAVINEGVKETSHKCLLKRGEIEDVIDGGVKETLNTEYMPDVMVEDTIQNGVKHTQERIVIKKSIVDDAIENGVKHTEYGDWLDGDERLDDIVENGVKETFNFDEKHALSYEQGVKKLVEDVIQNGVKETKTPGKDGDIMSTIEWMDENNSSSYTKMINDVIENGVKETLVSGSWNNDKMDEVIENGKLVSGTFVGGKRQKEDVESVIGYGTKNPSV